MIRKPFWTAMIVVVSVAASPMLAHADYNLQITSPNAGTSWQANANAFVASNSQWLTGQDPAPTGVALYLHAGSATGTVTNSGFAPINPASGSWNTMLQLVPKTPPVGGQQPTYHIEGRLWGQGATVQNPGPPPADVIRVIQFILVGG